MTNFDKELVMVQISASYLPLGHTGQTGNMTSCCSTLENKAGKNINNYNSRVQLTVTSTSTPTNTNVSS